MKFKTIRSLMLGIVTICLVTKAIAYAEQDWVQLTPASSPPQRCWSAMAYDPLRQEMIVFGGSDGSSVLGDTWIWNQTEWLIKGSLDSPCARYAHAMVYDEARNEVVLFGGLACFGGCPLDDTWVWNGTNWIQKSPVSSPSPRGAHRMAYDKARSEVILFGGGYAELNETWAWNGENWIRKSPTTTPRGRFEHAMAYDDARQEVLLFGGYGGPPPFLSDTWVWNGMNWTQKTPSIHPREMVDPTMVYDGVRREVVLFGGGDIPGPSNDTWTWDGTTWTLLEPSNRPSARYLHAMAYDPHLQEILLFGGYDNTQTLWMNDTWAWRTLKDTIPPVIGETSDIVAEATCETGAYVHYALPEAIDDVDGVVPVFGSPEPGSIFPLGETAVTCSATDTAGNMATRTFAVTVVDTIPPEATVSASPAELWPPNGKLVSVTVHGIASDSGSGVAGTSATYTIVDEYNEIQRGGTFTISTSGSFAFTEMLEARRNGTDKDGRRYSIEIIIQDRSGVATTKRVEIIVPHDQGS